MSVLKKYSTFRNILKNMGWRYVGFRGWFELSKKTGLLKRKFPQNPKPQKFISLSEWRKLPINFFFNSKEEINFPQNPSAILKNKIERLRQGELSFFNAEYKNIGTDYDWLTNPDSGFQYCLLYTSPSPRDKRQSRMPSSA